MFRFPRISSAATLALILALPAVAQDTAAPAPAAPAADTPAAPMKDVTADTVVATVGDRTVTLGAMAAMRANLPDQYKQLPDDVLFNGVLDQMIQQIVLGQSLTDPTPAEQKTLQNQETAVRASLMISRILAQPVTDAELKAAYDARFAAAAPETEYDASHILVPTEDEAKVIEDQLKAGGDFAAIAKEKSKDPGSAANGGELGWFGAGMMVPEFETAVAGMKKGDISAPVQTQFGWHIIKLNDTRVKAAPTMDEMHDELVQQIKDQRVQDAIAAAMAKADVKKDVEGIDKAVLKNEDLLK